MSKEAQHLYRCYSKDGRPMIRLSLDSDTDVTYTLSEGQVWLLMDWLHSYQFQQFLTRTRYD